VRPLSLELKVGVFALVVLVLLTFMTFRVGEINLFKKKGYILNVYFNDLAGLDKKTRVQVSGVDAGVIEGVALEDGKVRVKVRIAEHIKLYSDASATIKFTGLLGDKFLAITPGSKMPLLKDGDVIVNKIEATDVDSLIQNLSRVSLQIAELSSSLNEAIGPPESKQALKETIMNLKDITKNINTAIVNNDRSLKMVLSNLNDLSASLADFIKTNKEPFTATVANMKDFSGTLKDDGSTVIRDLNKATNSLREVIEENRPALRNTIENFDKISTKIESGEGTLGKLVNDEELYNSVNDAAKTVNKTMSALDRFRVFVTLKEEYLSRPTAGEGYLNVTLQPRPEDSFILGIVSNPVGKVFTQESTVNGVSTSEEEYSRQIQFTAQYGRRFTGSPAFKDTALRAGLMQNKFGIGADQYLANDKLIMSVDAWDFNRDDPDAKNPHLKAGADYFVFKHVFISGGLDDILSDKRRGAYVGGGVRFGN